MRVFLYIVLGIYMAFLAFEDIMKKTIPVSFLWLGILFIPVGLLTEGGSFSLTDNALGIIPGAVLLVISYVSRGQIGIGDGVLVAQVGASLGLEAIVRILTAALLLITAFSVIMLIFGKLKRKSTLPFIPFVFTGYLLGFFSC